MGNEKQKKKVNLLLILLLFLVGVLSAGMGLITAGQEELDGLVAILWFALWMLISLLFNTVAHEAGHLIFGKISGYKFCSFRVITLTLIKNREGKFRIKNCIVPGTAGQCLMAPPEIKDGKIPYRLFFWGGVIVNALTTAVFGVLFFVLWGNYLWQSAFFCIATLALYMALLNGIPYQNELICNDGYNAVSIKDDPDIIKALYIQLKISECLAWDIPIEQMPEELFVMPDMSLTTNTLVSAQAVFCCNRAMTPSGISEARPLIEYTLENSKNLLGLHKIVLLNDLCFLETITTCNKEVFDRILTAQQLSYMKSLKNNPSIMRTVYAYKLLALGNEDEADKIARKFEKVAKKYPYPAEAANEQALMNYAHSLYLAKTTHPQNEVN